MDTVSGIFPGFILILFRIGAFLGTCPILSWTIIPNQSKIAIGLILSLFFSALVPNPFMNSPIHFVEFILIGVQETIYGLSLGLVAFALFSVVNQSASIVERQMGLTMANVMDPFSGNQARPISMLMEMVFILLLLSTNSHHILLSILSRSFDHCIPGAVPTVGQLTESIILATSGMLLLALQMSAPLLCAFLLLLIVLGFMAKVAPETNILFLSIPVRLGLGLFIVGVFVPFMYEYVDKFIFWMGEFLPY